MKTIVKKHTRRLKSGKIIFVKRHSRDFRKKARRKYYTQTTLKQRLKDEKTLDPVVNSISDYNPLEKDVMGIDDPLPKDYKITMGIGQNAMDKKFHRKSLFFLLSYRGRQVGGVSVSEFPKDKTLIIGFGNIEPEFRGRLLYPYLRRTIVNYADKKGYILQTIPYSETPNITNEELTDHYASYGSKDKIDVGYDTIYRYPHK